MQERRHRILVINPGSTSTKVGLFEGGEAVFTETVAHDASVLAGMGSVSAQLSYRRDTILEILARHGLDLSTVDAFVGRGGGLVSCEGGTYEVSPRLLADARACANGVEHPANLGSQLANEFALLSGNRRAPCFVVNPPDTDELCDEARITGIRGVYRNVHLHALNLKETAIRHAVLMGRSYESLNLVVCHLGGGISISAHEGGRMIDGFDIVGGEGPMTPTRCGSVPVTEVLSYLRECGPSKVQRLCQREGGFSDLLGTSDAVEVSRRADEGDKACRLVWSAMLYQVSKAIGAMACALGGKVDGILLGGGLAHSEELVSYVRNSCGWIAPVTAYPGEFELEAMAAGAERVLNGEERAKVYTGEPVFSGFDCLS